MFKEKRMKKQLFMIVLTSIIIISGFSGCTEKDPLSGLGYIQRDEGFGLNPPEKWIVNENDPKFSVVFETTSATGYLITFGVSVAPCLPEQTLSFIVEGLLQLFETNENCSVASNNTRTINGMNAHEIIIVMSFESMDVKQKYVLIKKDNRIFNLLYSAPFELYDNYISVVETSINSFIIR